MCFPLKDRIVTPYGVRPLTELQQRYTELRFVYVHFLAYIMAATNLNHNIPVTIYAYSISAGKNFFYQVLHLTYTQSDRPCK
jgi:hypothetical protein